MQLKIPQLDYIHLARQIKLWGEELGFQQVAITDIDLKKTGEKLNKWLESGYHGEYGLDGSSWREALPPRAAAARHMFCDNCKNELPAC